MNPKPLEINLPEPVSDAPSSTPSNAAREITLPSGRKALIRKGTGRDQIEAHKIAKGDGATELMYGLIARMVLIDAKPVKYEEVLEMDIEDVMELQASLFPKAKGKLQS
jgi:hypothetical protein